MAQLKEKDAALQFQMNIRDLNEEDLMDSEEIGKTVNSPQKKDIGSEEDDDIIGYTSNEVFESLEHGDESGEVIGFIDSVTARQEVGNGPRKFHLMKFVINNDNGKRMTCLLWGNEMINKFQNEIIINRIVHIERGYIKSCKTFASRDTALVPFELVLQLNTTMEYLGDHVSGPAPITSPVDVNFQTVTNAIGPVRIEGYVKTKFVTSQKFNSSSTYGSGAITDGEYKVTVNVTNFTTDLKIDKGAYVTVVGEVKRGTGPIVIVCNKSSDIVVKSSVKKMPIGKLVKGIKTPKRC